MRDYKMAFGIGLASSVLWFFVLSRLSFPYGGELIAALVALPFLLLLGVALVRRWFHRHIFHKFAKFLIVGVLNTGIDFFVFNMAIAATGLATGMPVALFKSFSFACALFNSYELNRLWTFYDEAAPLRTKKEFSRFAAITIVGFIVNVGTTSLIVAAIRPLFGLSQVRWDNVAAAVATALNLAWNFFGYKVFVFKSEGRQSELISSNVV